MRFAIPAMIIAGGGPTFERPQSQEISDFILVMFLLIGAIGLLTSYGLWKGETWGYFGTIILSLAIMVFDLWAVFSIQSSAAMGLVLPMIFIIYLWTIRKDFSKGDRQ
ncbi:MAG: hypothetical protein QW520_01305 [Methanomassiliicoccales archaeon]